jgi:hypothetical protein
MNQQEGTKSGTVSGLCAGRTMKETKCFWKHCGGVGGEDLASQLA